MCYIAGWGNKQLKTPLEPRLLQTVVPLVSKEKCNHIKSYGGMITDNMVCAGFEMGGKDTCEGDSGGKPQIRLSFLFMPRRSKTLGDLNCLTYVALAQSIQNRMVCLVKEPSI